MPGVKKLRKIELGTEGAGTPGTAVAASTLWRGLGTLEDQTEVVFVEEDVGYLSGLDRTMIPKVRGELVMDEVPATFEQLPYILEAGVLRVATPTGDAPGSGQQWPYIFPTTAPNTIQTFTIEGGDDQQAEEMAYCFVTDFKIAGAADEAVKMGATWTGRQIAPTSFTGSGLPSVEEILFNTGRLYIDAVGGTIGSTLVSNLLISMALAAMTGLKAYQAADGYIYFSGQKSIGPEVTLEVKFEHITAAVTEKAAWLAETPRQIRLDFQGTALTTPNTWTTKLLRIDLAGKWESFSALEDQDGNDIVTGLFRGRYNATAALFCEIYVVNELATLP